MEVMETNYGVKRKLAVNVTAASLVELTSAVLGYEPSTRHHTVLVHTFSGTSIALEASADETNWVELAKITAKGILSTVNYETTFPYLRLVQVGGGGTGSTVDIISKHVSLDQKWA
jgi:hypothetical protein